MDNFSEQTDEQIQPEASGLNADPPTLSIESPSPRPNPNPATPRSADSNPGVIGGAFWFLATVTLVLTAWYIGPVAIERYQYAATKGRVSAEYQNAREVLGGLPLQDVSLAFQLVAQRIKPSVVSIMASGVVNRDGSNWGGQGSGVIMSSEGYILTNEHVVRGSESVQIGLHDRRQFEGRVVGVDEMSDLAVIKIEAEDLFPAEWGDSDALSVGSMVWAVGSPYGLEQTVTSGILSAKERGNGALRDVTREYLQTDAAVNPGNSGGPLVNARGEVIGINTSIFGTQFQGISFAIPSAIARFVFEQIIDRGTVTRSYLGIFPTAVQHADMIQMKLPDLNGALVSDIPENGPAYQSELKVGDVIRRWDGNEIKTFHMLFRFVEMTRPDSEVDVEVLRGGQPMRLRLSVVKRPEDDLRRRRSISPRRQNRE